MRQIAEEASALQRRLVALQRQQAAMEAEGVAEDEEVAAALPDASGVLQGGYSAGDAPEMRKNRELYEGLEGVRVVVEVDAVEGGGEGAAEGEAAEALQQGAAEHLVATHTLPGGLKTKPEVLAPAGGWPQLRAAVENGADAVYFGVTDFNARARASNFTPEELEGVMGYLHARGVKGYVVLNVLVFDEELQRLESRVRQIAQAGVDAVIVQDLGATEMIRRVAPSLPIHGSTQMSITSAEGVRFAEQLGVSRVVVGRELSVREIAKVKEGANAEVEAFVHGALCVSYSGQCFSSEAWGGRSANRGQCAQACRMPYGLIVNGELKELGDMKYLLSPQDLMAVELVPELMTAGVSCFKIEGRLKGPEYVALTTRLYREAVDRSWASMLGDDAAGVPAGGEAAAMQRAKESVELAAETRAMLEQVFARGQDAEHRGLTHGFLAGVQHQQLVRGRAPRHRGLYLGKVERVDGKGVVRKRVWVRLAGPVKRGDGVVFDLGNPEEAEAGGSVYQLYRESGAVQEEGWTVDDLEAGGVGLVAIELGDGQVVDWAKVKPGALVWKTKDAALESTLRKTYDGLSAAASRRLPVSVTVSGRLGEPLVMVLEDGDGNTAYAASTVTLAEASRRPMGGDDVRKAVGDLGDNTFRTARLDLSGLALEDGIFLPASELKSVRRDAVEQLQLQRQVAARRTTNHLAEEPVVRQLWRQAQATGALDTLSGLASGGAKGGAEGAAAERAERAERIGGVGEEAREAMAEVGGGTWVVRAGAARAAKGAAQTAKGVAKERGGVASVAGREARAREEVNIRLLCRSKAQVEAAVELPWLREVVLDFLEVQGLREACLAVRAAGKRVVVATPRVLKPDEQRLWLFYLRLGADSLLVRSTGMLHHLLELGGPGAAVAGVEQPIPELEGDFSLNAANVVTAALMLGAGVSRLTPTYDLNASQLANIARGLGAGAGKLEALAHQHLPIFHTEHCVFCRFLSDGNSYKDCGHPCETSSVHLRDHAGSDHLVLADMGCRNTVFNAEAQSAAYYIQDLVRAGYRHLRIELVDEPAECVAPLAEGYRDVVLGRRTPRELWELLNSMPDANGRAHGVGEGSLGVHKERSASTLRPTAAARRAAAV